MVSFYLIATKEYVTVTYNWTSIYFSRAKNSIFQNHERKEHGMSEKESF